MRLGLIGLREWMSCLGDKEKLGIVEGFQKVVPLLRDDNVKELMRCVKCGEPSSGEVCNFCGVVGSL